MGSIRSVFKGDKEEQAIFEKELQTGVTIDATAERIWDILTDLDSYPQWNPMIRQASGEVQAGSRLKVRFAPEGSKGHTFRPKLLVVEPGRELRWLGWPRFPKLFDSEHYWIISSGAGGKILLQHGLLVYGALAPLAGKIMISTSKIPFEEMNRALKERVESGYG